MKIFANRPRVDHHTIIPSTIKYNIYRQHKTKKREKLIYLVNQKTTHHHHQHSRITQIMRMERRSSFFFILYGQRTTNEQATTSNDKTERMSQSSQKNKQWWILQTHWIRRIAAVWTELNLWPLSHHTLLAFIFICFHLLSCLVLMRWALLISPQLYIQIYPP